MKNMFQCERCGKLFDDYSECSDHESKHWDPEIDVWNTEKQEVERLTELTEYKTNQEEPEYIHIRLKRWANNSSGEEFRYGKYRLVSSYSAPIKIVADDTESK